VVFVRKGVLVLRLFHILLCFVLHLIEDLLIFKVLIAPEKFFVSSANALSLDLLQLLFAWLL
jgi:hypothetical protein